MNSDAAVFGAMPDRALFVNAGRGATVDQAALLDAVPRISAVLDVADPEPLPADHALWSADGVLAITGHQAGDSARRRRALRDVRLGRCDGTRRTWQRNTRIFAPCL